MGGPGIRFTGFAAGREKYELLASLNVLCAPSHQENFGMSIAEGLLAGTPVIASKGTPWEELDTRRCGWWRDNSPAALAAALEEAFNLTPEESRAMGDRGRSLIMETYASPQVAASMKRLPPSGTSSPPAALTSSSTSGACPSTSPGCAGRPCRASPCRLLAVHHNAPDCNARLEGLRMRMARAGESGKQGLPAPPAERLRHGYRGQPALRLCP